MSQSEGREHTYLLKKVVGSLGKRVERVDVILGENNKQEFIGRVLPALGSFPGSLNQAVLVHIPCN